MADQNEAMEKTRKLYGTINVSWVQHEYVKPNVIQWLAEYMKQT